MWGTRDPALGCPHGEVCRSGPVLPPEWRQLQTRKSMNVGVTMKSKSQGRPSHQWSATGRPGPRVRSLCAKHHAAADLTTNPGPSPLCP